MIRRPPSSTLFPDPTLFRSLGRARYAADVRAAPSRGLHAAADLTITRAPARPPPAAPPRRATPAGMPSAPARRAGRSEEHTSELQSRQYLVCRLLLEKKRTL